MGDQRMAHDTDDGTDHETDEVKWGSMRAAARLMVLSGPSGVGKDAVIEVIRKRSPWVWLSVSVTTRRKRDYEVDGEHYHFVSRREFDQLVEDCQLLEW